jgi:hypothetical protein
LRTISKAPGPGDLHLSRCLAGLQAGRFETGKTMITGRPWKNLGRGPTTLNRTLSERCGCAARSIGISRPGARNNRPAGAIPTCHSQTSDIRPADSRRSTSAKSSALLPQVALRHPPTREPVPDEGRSTAGTHISICGQRACPRPGQTIAPEKGCRTTPRWLPTGQR